MTCFSKRGLRLSMKAKSGGRFDFQRRDRSIIEEPETQRDGS